MRQSELGSYEVDTIVCGDCLDIMAAMPADCVDAIVTDPPYGLEFMGEEWDRLWSTCNAHKDFSMGHKNDPYLGARVDKYAVGSQAQVWHYKWAVEAYRVLKPGGYLLAMGGTRTFHRLTCALEDSGFEIRDCLMYLYGQGFPKSYNLSKGYDRRAFKSWLDPLDHGLTRAEARKVVSAAVNGGGYFRMSDGRLHKHGHFIEDNEFGKSVNRDEGSRLLTSLLARFWEPLAEAGRHRAWQAIVGDHQGCDVGMPPGMRLKVGRYDLPDVADGRRGKSWGLTREACRRSGGGNVPITPAATQGRALTVTAPSTPLAKEWEGWGSGLKPAWEPVVIAYKRTEEDEAIEELLSIIQERGLELEGLASNA